MTDDERALRDAYTAFNARDIDGVLASMHAEVDWPNKWQGGYVHGHAGVRDYWTRQWQSIDPRVEPQGFTVEEDGRVAVTAHQFVRDRASGAVIADVVVQHVYLMQDGLIRRMDIREQPI